MGVQKKWIDSELFAVVQIAIAAFTGHCHVKFSLIVGTLGRSAELAQLFDSLVVQTHHNFEIIVVDQNDDDRAKLVVDRFIDRLNILHLASAKGLSRARNVGLAHVTGDVVAFPDDDCCYPRTVLETVAKQLSGDAELSGVTGLAAAWTKMAAARKDAGPPSLFSSTNSTFGFVQRPTPSSCGLRW